MNRAITYCFLLLTIFKVGYSQRTIDDSFENVYDFKEVCFYETPLVFIEKHDIKRTIFFDTVATEKSTNNIIQYLNSIGKIDRISTDSSFNLLVSIHYNNIVNELVEIYRDSDTIFNSDFTEAINKYNERYICFVIQNGFFYSKNKRRNKNTTSIIVSIVTIGMMIPMPVMASSAVHFYVLDKETKKIVYKDTDYKNLFNKEAPYEKYITDNQITSLMVRLQEKIKYNNKNKIRQDKREKRKSN